ncbi:MAG TPA: DUF2442 domain-containing protein [Thiotrichales bacterium]|jgi:hypothetical protein|nr:MAG: hypothetical protein B7Y68_08545 [Thiotrichales bacterium 35-46-9]OZA16646.1 MAG: hypothetical protein B7X85_06260 [Thiotrichales bacterium 17-46-47]HQR83030.1 DUF2442 domain-containing protein [Thiotrichales bacterium]HQR96841.1 DUF2442 domain-containing protein [Thiotrichales bacterium]HQT03262.1 DUF2442 domain-containing protein [Thiotrichales bacterium]
MRISSVELEDNYLLHVVADDGTEGVFDVKPYLQAEAFEPLKDLSEFKSVHNGKYYIEWACGADLSADTIMARRVLM